MNKGFVIMAQNTSTTDYELCAKHLKNSILNCMPDASVTIITTDMLPYGDQAPESSWKLSNDWQVYDASPYEYTIKLEADMIVPQSIEFWWDILKHRDLVVSSTIRNFKNVISDVTEYRQFIYNNNLPDVYNAVTYFKKSKTAEDFFKIVKNIFQNWDEYKKILKCNVGEQATTDWVYAIACHIMGAEHTTMDFPAMSMIHMKSAINNLFTENWTNELVYEFNPLRVNTFPQMYPFHYHVKEFAHTLEETYE